MPNIDGGLLRAFALISGHGDLARLQREGDVLRHRQVRIERVALEDHRDLPLARAARSLTTWPPIRMSPLVGCSSPAIIAQSVVLPQPRGAEEDEELRPPGWQSRRHRPRCDRRRPSGSASCLDRLP